MMKRLFLVLVAIVLLPMSVFGVDLETIAPTITGIYTFTAIPVFNGGIDLNESFDVDFNANDEYVTITNSAEYTAGKAQVTINNTDNDVGAQMWLLELQYTDDGQANADFFTCSDAAGTDKFTIGEEGNTAIVGTLGVTGAATFESTITVSGITSGGDTISDFSGTNLTVTSGKLDVDDAFLTNGADDSFGNYKLTGSSITLTGERPIIFGAPSGDRVADTPDAVGQLMMDSSYNLFVATGTDAGQWKLIGAQSE